MSKCLFLFLAFILSVNCIEEEIKNIILSQVGIRVKTIGKKGTAVMMYRQEEQIQVFKDAKKKPSFDSTISNQGKTYSIKCGVFNGRENSEYIYVFCNFDESIPSGTYTLSLAGTAFNYEDYHITLKDGTFDIQKVDKDIIDLYSEPQTITIDNTFNNCELKFNIVSYNQEMIMLNYGIILECNIKDNILHCPLTRKELLANLQKETTECEVQYLNTTEYDETPLYLVSPIKIIVKDIQKKDITVNIKKLLVDTNEHDVPIAYETDVTNVSNYYLFSGSENFELKFMNENEQGEKTLKDKSCSFLKYDNNPLYLVCWVNGEKTNWLNEITSEEKVENYHIQYNYKIQPVKNEAKIQYKGSGSFISWYHPKVIDFTKNNGPISIIYWIENPQHLKGFTYNEEADDLKCEDVGGYYKKCEVTKEHFKGKKSGDYFLKHTNHLEKKSTNYEVPPIKVILEETPVPSKGNIIFSSLLYSFGLLLIMI